MKIFKNESVKFFTYLFGIGFGILYLSQSIVSMVNVYQVGHLVNNVDKRINYETTIFLTDTEYLDDWLPISKIVSVKSYHKYYSSNWETKDTVCNTTSDMDTEPRNRILMSCIKDNNEAMLMMAQNKRFLFIINPFKFLKKDLLLYPQVYDCVYSKYKEKKKQNNIKTKQKQLKSPDELNKIYSTWECK